MVQLKCYVARIAMLLAVLASDASASIQLPSMFASAMVLQHDEAVALWGVALPNVDVSINYYSSRSSSSFQWNGKARSTSSGRFDVILPAQPVSTLPYTLTIAATGSNNITLKDILIGKVFVCSGQSNMELNVGFTVNQTAEIAASVQYGSMLRIFQVAQEPVYGNATVPQDNLTAAIPWARASPANVWGMSAMCYYFGVEQVRRHSNTPIGMIASSWGGTAIAVWMSPEALAACKKATVANPLSQQQQQEQEQEQLEGGEEHLIQLQLPWRNPDQSAATSASACPIAPSSLYNSMIHPLLPLAVSGYLWYQGEANAANPWGYQCAFPSMITTWREAWAQARPSATAAGTAASAATPFIFVQLAPWPANENGLLPVQRYAQLNALEVPNVGMVVAADIGDPAGTNHPIHPPYKQEVARRAAVIAENLVHGDAAVPALGPVPVNVSWDPWEPSWGDYHHGIAEGEGCKGGPDGVWRCGGIRITFDQPIVLKNVATGEGNALDRGMASGGGFELWNNATADAMTACRAGPNWQCPLLGPTGDLRMSAVCTNWKVCPLAQQMEVGGVLADGKTLQLNVTFIQGQLKTLKYAWSDYPTMVVYDAVNGRPAPPFNMTIEE